MQQPPEQSQPPPPTPTPTPTQKAPAPTESDMQRAWRQVDWQGRVALAMALMLGISLIIFTSAVLYDAVVSQGPGLSSNATQVLTAAFSSMIGALSVWLGSRRSSGGPNDNQ